MAWIRSATRLPARLRVWAVACVDEAGGCDANGTRGFVAFDLGPLRGRWGAFYFLGPCNRGLEI